MKYEGSRDVNEAYTQWREFRRVPVPRLVNKIGISRYMEIRPPPTIIPGGLPG